MDPQNNQQNVQLREVRKWQGGKLWPAETDILTLEEPLEIRIDDRPVAVVMRTPGNDVALVRGFLLTEGIVAGLAQVASVESQPATENDSIENVVNVTMAEGTEIDPDQFSRNFYSTSSCGICGKSSIEAVRLKARPVVGKWKVASASLLALPEKMRERQTIFAKTGSIHAAALFDLEGALVVAAEDIGRHNAVDKVIGAVVTKGDVSFAGSILAVSGRISFEIAQKALMAGIPMIVAVSGASSLAVELAEDQGLTLIGFARGESMTVYHGAWRLEESAPSGE